MPFRRLDDVDPYWLPKKQCRDPEHAPPKHLLLAPGRYEYECPSCHETQTVTVAGTSGA